MSSDRSLTVVIVGTQPTTVQVQQRLTDSHASRHLPQTDLVVAEPTITLSLTQDLWALDSALARLGNFDWLLLLSKPAVRFMTDRLHALHLTVPTGSKPQVAAVGEATAQAATEAGYEVAFVGTGTAADLIRDLSAHAPLKGSSVLVPRSAAGDVEGMAALTEFGADVQQVVAYANAPLPLNAQAWSHWASVASSLVLVALSGSAIKAVAEGLAADVLAKLKGAMVVAMGPGTAEMARELGFEVRGVAEPPTVPSLCLCVMQLCDRLRERGTTE